MLKKYLLLLSFLPGVLLSRPGSAGLADTLASVKPSIVAVGTLQLTRRPPAVLRGSGFVVADGHYVVTNAHVIPDNIDTLHKESLMVFTGSGRTGNGIPATVAGRDNKHDLALLKIEGAALPAMQLGDSDKVREGEDVAFTGFPIGPVLGLYPATHRAVIAAITPVAVPGSFRSGMSATRIRRLDDPYRVFQLDATAYPGNSGSPVYDVESGEVLGVINKVFVQASKEDLLSRPSGITYAIPARHIHALLRRAGVSAASAP